MTGATPRVRFAPSPTGYLHIGGARTALYNWLYARKTGGVFVLRIEDTDAERSTEASYRSILDALEWLGLDWDEGPGTDGPFGPYLQSARQVLYHTDVRRLIEKGLAYHCFCTQDELAELRTEAMQTGGSPSYDGRCRNLPADEVERRLARNVSHVIRLRMPDGETKVYDLIRGPITFQNSELDDFVLIKSDGKPTYNFAAVVDDAKMKITHVIRGDDHLSNTPKQVVIYRALGYALPKFAHLPMILGSDRTRLSKRHGAASVQEFRRMGYLSDSLVNYLALLGWAYDDKTEYFTRESLIKKFSLKKVSKNPARFDPDKLDHIDGEHFTRLEAMKRVALVYERLRLEQVLPADFHPAELSSAAASVPESRPSGNGEEAAYRAEVPRLAIILGAMGNRLRNLKEAAAKLSYFYKDTYPVDDEAVEKHLRGTESGRLLTALAERFEMLDSWDRGAIEETTRALADELGVGAGKLIHPCRVALTGQSVSPDLFTVVHLLGKQKSVERLRAAASIAASIGG